MRIQVLNERKSSGLLRYFLIGRNRGAQFFLCTFIMFLFFLFIPIFFLFFIQQNDYNNNGDDMRIVGGKFRSREIDFPQDASITRPTKDRVREGMFNALSSFCVDANVLDLFAGSGALGLEAYSRGAASVTFVDQSPKAISIIEKNCKKLLVPASILQVSSETFLSMERKEPFDLIFLDPPYAFDQWSQLEEQLWEKGFLSPRGILIVETEIPVMNHFLRDYEKKKEYHYGRTLVTILWRKL